MTVALSYQRRAVLRYGAGGVNVSMESFFGNDLLGVTVEEVQTKHYKRGTSGSSEYDLYPISCIAL